MNVAVENIHLSIPKSDMNFFSELTRKMGWTIEPKPLVDAVEQGYSDYLKGNVKAHSEVKKRYEKHL